jgi:hypothetical protein
VVSLLEGGYALSALGRSAAEHVRVRSRALQALVMEQRQFLTTCAVLSGAGLPRSMLRGQTRRRAGTREPF